VWKYRARRYLVFGWFWFLGTLVPMIGLIQVGNQAMADRYAYLPFLGIFIMAVWGAAELAQSNRIPSKYAAFAGVSAVLAFTVATRAQIYSWHDDFTLWSHALAVTHDNFVAENNFGSALMRQGRREEAIAHFRNAAVIEPDDATSQMNLGIYAHEQ